MSHAVLRGLADELDCSVPQHLQSTQRTPLQRNDIDILERASCQAGFCDEAVGLTMCWQCAVGATLTSARNCTLNEVLLGGTNKFQEVFERITKDMTASAPSTMKIKVVAPPDGNIFTVGAKHCPYSGTTVSLGVKVERPRSRCCLRSSPFTSFRFSSQVLRGSISGFVRIRNKLHCGT